MYKHSWKLGALFACQDCGRTFEDKQNGQANAARHAKMYRHEVTGEVVIASDYNGKKD